MLEINRKDFGIPKILTENDYLDTYEGCFTEDELNEAFESENYLIEMANISANKIKLPYKLWVDGAGDRRQNKHNEPRVKFLVNNNWVPIEFAKNEYPKIPDSAVKNLGFSKFPHMSECLEWVDEYREILEARFFNKIDDIDALNLLGPLKEAPNNIKELHIMLDKYKDNSYIEIKWDFEESMHYIKCIIEGKEKYSDYTLDVDNIVNELQKKYMINDIRWEK